MCVLSLVIVMTENGLPKNEKENAFRKFDDCIMIVLYFWKDSLLPLNIE